MEEFRQSDNNDDRITELPAGVDGNEKGHVIVKDGLSVSLSEEDSIHVFLNVDSREEVRIGMYIQIPYPYSSSLEEDDAVEKGTNDELFGIIEDIEYVSRDDIDEYKEIKNKSRPDNESNETQHPLVAKIDPISTIKKRQNGNEVEPYETKSLDSVPKPRTNVYTSDKENYMRTGLGIPEDGITVGYLTANGLRLPPDSPLTYKIMNPGADSEEEAAVWRHSLIAGSTGVGKSHTAKNIIRQLTDGPEYEIEDKNGNRQTKEPCIFIIDPENEYSQMGQNPEEADEELLNKLEREHNVVTGGVNQRNITNFDLKPFIPDVKGTDDPNLSGKSMDFSIPFEMTKKRTKIAMNYSAPAPTFNAAKSILRKFFDENQSTTYDDFMNWIDSTLNDNHREEMGINESSWDAALQRFDSNTFRRVFDSGSQSIYDISEDMFQSGRVSVIPTGHLDVGSQNLVVMAILSMIVENKIGAENRDEIKETPVILCLDEAHNYLSESESMRDRYIVNKFRSAAKQGRKYKLGLMMITQNPEDIDEEIRKQTNTRIYLGLREESLDKLNLKPRIRKQVSDFGKGQMIVQSPGVDSVEVEGFSECVTKHN
jgi:DNA helicase HerA-like ATPase